jgi:hypothetical protein
VIRVDWVLGSVLVIDEGWVLALGLSIVACLCGESIGEQVFGRRAWFEKLSVEHSGVSVWRILLGVVIALLFVSLMIIARLIFLRIFH